jgi:23S rRNA (cytidine1920-2'-O)/16S rRNA (cytidine1409-2'-O)-methyltransferase
MTRRRRIDEVLVDRGLADDLDAAKDLIARHVVTIDNAPVLGGGRLVDAGEQVRVIEPSRYVSRGGLKLESALRDLGLDVSGMRVIDVGASTGGFVDCLLTHGAATVTACDVGRGLLHPRIAADPRVVVRDSLNCRDLADAVARGEVAPDHDLVVADVSFISLRAVRDGVRAAVRPGGGALLLVKPQFEARRQEVDAGGGVIRDDAVRRRCVDEVAATYTDAGWRELGRVDCALHGPAGNREMWLWLAAGDVRSVGDEQIVT